MHRTKASKLAIAAFALALSLVALRTADASGYMVACGITGEITCNPGGGDDCPST